MIKNRQRVHLIDIKRFEQVAQKMLEVVGYPEFDLGILITTDQSIRRYNRDFRGKDQPTDVLSFPYHHGLKAGDKIVVLSDDDKNLGDIIFSAASVKKKAALFDRSFKDHLYALLAHAIAHLLGYDHETEADFKKMQKIENLLLNKVLSSDFSEK